VTEPQPYGSHLPSRLIAIGASAGGVRAISDLVGALPADLDGAVLVVLHLSPTAHSALPSILARRTPLRVFGAVDGSPLETGTVYVAPPDFHLGVAGGVVRVPRGPCENGHRPSIDALFRSVADAAGPRAVAIVLSGALDDGAAGLVAVHLAGGTTLVQDPHEAAVPDMPLNALSTGVTAERLTVAEIAKRVIDLCRERPAPLAHTSGRMSPTTHELGPSM
jgi:two-component system chemotaxis response regulator CheB